MRAQSPARPRRDAASRRRPYLPAVGTLLLLLAISPAAWGETWYESYHRAEVAIEEQDWSAALLALDSAIEAKPTPAARARTYGMRFVEYFPYLQLATVYFHLGQYDAAIDALETETGHGEITEAPRQRAALQALEERIDSARDRARRETENQRQRVLAESLARARQLGSEGRPADALAALDRALAVADDDGEVTVLREQLLDQLAEDQRAALRDRQFDDLVAKGTEAMRRDEPSVAASLLTQALQLKDDPAARSMFAEAQTRLRAQIESAADTEPSTATSFDVTEELRRARRLFDRGELEASMTAVQRALAVDRSNASAQALVGRIAQRRQLESEAAENTRTLESLLAEAGRHAADGRIEAALRAANRALALDPGSERASTLVTASYSRLNTALLATSDEPPLLLFDESLLREGGLRGRTRSSRFVLRGSVFASSPVDVVATVGDQSLPVDVDGRALADVWVSQFEIPLRLTPGSTRIEVEAIDPTGSSSSLGYEIDYAVPFTRSVWLPVTAAVALLFLFAAWVTVRARRRRQLLARRFNPYVAGAPVLDQKRFFGRQELLEYVLRRVTNNSIMLYGERRIGKTSLQHQLKRALETLDDPAHSFHPVFVDLQGTPQESFFATVATEIFHELSPLLDGLKPQPALADGSYGHRDLVKDLHAVLQALARKTEKKVKLVLLIDEVDELNDYDPRVNQRLRSLFMRAFAENLVAVVSGVSIKKQWEREGSPWYNFLPGDRGGASQPG